MKRDVFAIVHCTQMANLHATANSDKNCGAAFNAATDDTLSGSACRKSNPSNAVAPPSNRPVCV